MGMVRPCVIGALWDYNERSCQSYLLEGTGVGLFDKLFKKKLPEVYSEDEQNTIETHISTCYGKFDSVLHEIVSPDIHVDICVIPPTTDRNYFTMVTMGMGAHRMNVPKELRNQGFDRAELLIALPSDWNIEDEDEKWYWPLRWLKILARLPGENNSWLGYGHTIPNGEPFAENTLLSGIMLTMPYFFGQEAASCRLGNGESVNFYQLMPLFDDEMNYKLEHGAEALEDLFSESFDLVVDIGRKSVVGT